MEDNIKELDSLDAYKRGKKDTKKKAIYLTSFLTLVSLSLGTVIGISINKLMDPVPAKVREIYKVLRDNWFYQGEIEDLEKELVYMMTSGLDENNYDNYLIYTDNYADQGLDLTGNGAFGATFNNYYTTLPNGESYGGFRIVKLANGKFKQAGFKVDDVIIAFKAQSDPSYQLIEDYSPSLALAFMKPVGPTDKTKFKVVRNNEIIDLQSGIGSYTEDQFTDYGLTASDVNEDTVLTIGINSFLGSNTFIQDFKNIVESYADTAKIDRLVLDMRNNGGGYTSYSRDLISLFLKKEQTMYTEKNFEGKTFASYKQTVNPYKKLFNTKVDILLNDRSASATELFALALKDNLRATIYGDTSYGKGIEQTVVRLEDDSYLRLTTAQIYGPNGYSIHKKGIEPDHKTNFYTSLTENVVSNPYVEYGYRLSYTEEEKVLKCLKQLGYNITETTKLNDALKIYQKDHKLEETGEYDSKTLYRIQGELSKLYQDCYNRERTNLSEGIIDEVRPL